MVVWRFFQQERCSQKRLLLLQASERHITASTTASPSATVFSTPQSDAKVPNESVGVYVLPMRHLHVRRYLQTRPCFDRSACNSTGAINVYQIYRRMHLRPAHFFLRKEIFALSVISCTLSPNKSLRQTRSNWRDKQPPHEDATSDAPKSNGPSNLLRKIVAGAEVQYSQNGPNS
ncbi:hypothetical protein BDU57DRAFT_48981 [Ampelomyces quisqualis]|uniref:Uncharacterized protein n=1 Tax=Ampelomyces quisqualis TaxID=50730 RepID=A0A6A5R3N3_AMPQU|nr:hypothetical protein BDU57DRAFT_48981 [Ampelomyces quisqualis]